MLGPMDLRAEKTSHSRTAWVANPTRLRAENMGIGSVSSPAGLRAEKDKEKLTVEGQYKVAGSMGLRAEKEKDKETVQGVDHRLNIEVDLQSLHCPKTLENKINLLEPKLY